MFRESRIADSESFHPVHFRGLNIDVDLLLWTAPQESTIVERVARDWFRGAEARFSRSVQDSELNLLNRLAGERCLISDVMFEVLSLSEQFRKATLGAYNPLKASDRSARMFMDAQSKSIQMPHESSIDLDDIVPCWLTQSLCAFFKRRMKLKQGLIKAGGVHQVWGRPSGKFDPWVIGIPSPWNEEEELGSLALSEGAASIYTAQTINAPNSAVQCIVSGDDAVKCGVWAKVICELGPEQGLPLFSQHADHCEALLVTAEKKVHFYGSKHSIGGKWRDIEVDLFH